MIGSRPLVAVLDIGKTNIKLNVATADGDIIETVSTANIVRPGPPYRHPDLPGIETWLFGELRSLARQHPIGTFVCCAHGSAGVLVDDAGPVLPPIDYEQDPPEALNRSYRELAGSIEARGSRTMAGTAHLARQLLWMQTEWPDVVSRARWFLGAPQYWAWRLSGVAASEVTYLAAQSHLWDIPAASFARLVAERGWTRLLPGLQPAWQVLGLVKPDLAHRHGLPPDMEVLCGVHDSSANFYRYRAAGLADVSVISTGTWIVGVSDRFAPEALARTGGMTWNADVEGRPLTGMLSMGGREFAAIAGEGPDAPADPQLVCGLVGAGTMALPTFAFDDGPFPGSAGRGCVIGPPPQTAAERRALALLYVALLTDHCLDLMGSAATTVLDGSFVRDPLYPALVAALRPGARTLFSTDANGTAAGAALLADHATRTAPAPVTLDVPAILQIPGLDVYRKGWRDLAGKHAAGGGTGRDA